jgi:hypothetical protein
MRKEGRMKKRERKDKNYILELKFSFLRIIFIPHNIDKERIKEE